MHFRNKMEACIRFPCLLYRPTICIKKKITATITRTTCYILLRDDLETHFSAEASKSGRQSTLQFKPVAKTTKKNPWSDEESDANLSDNEMESEEEVVAPRERADRKTKGEPDH